MKVQPAKVTCNSNVLECQKVTQFSQLNNKQPFLNHLILQTGNGAIGNFVFLPVYQNLLFQ